VIAGEALSAACCHAAMTVVLGKAADLGWVGTLDVLDRMPSVAPRCLECIERLHDRRVADGVHLHLPSALARDARCGAQLVGGPKWGARSPASPSYGSSIARSSTRRLIRKGLTIPLLLIL